MSELSFQALRDFLPGLIQKLEKEVPYAAAFASRKEGVRVMASSTQTQVLPENPHPGLCITLWNGGRFFEFATNRLDTAAIENGAMDLANKAASLKEGKAQDLDAGEALSKDFSTPFKTDFSKIPLKDKLDWARELQQLAAKSSPKIQNAIAVSGGVETEEIFVNRAKNLRQRLLRYDEMVQVYVSDGKRVQQLWDGNGLAGGWEHKGLAVKQVAPMVKDAERLLSGSRLEPGFYDIVTDPDWSGILAHEAFGHGMETDMFLKDRAKGRDYLGKKVASEVTSLYDDPSYPGQAGTFFFDHEGALSRPNLIIDKGQLKAGMTDFYSASLLKLPRSANGRRESWERKAYARMTNTFFSPGASKPPELISAVDDGIYLRYPSNGMEDPQGWGIQCEGLWAQRIKKGKLTDEIHTPVIMTGFVPDILASIKMVGDDLLISGLGYCGKGHKEYVKNTTGGPHLLLKARLA